MNYTPQPVYLPASLRVNTFMCCLIYTLLFSISTLCAQTNTVSGIFKDSSGVALPGVAVKVRDTKAGVYSNSLGQFSMRLKAGSILDISAVGFDDTCIVIGNIQSPLIIILKMRQNNLADVAITARNETITGNDPVANEIIFQQIFTDFAITAGYASGHVGNGGSPMFGPQNKVNTGEFVPYYMPKQATKGSRYLLPGYVGGIVLDSGNNLINNSVPIYNYDKINGTLIIRKDAKNCIEIDKSEVKAFGLKNNDTTYLFVRIPAIDANRYFEFVGKGIKYALFKGIKAKFIRSDYRSNGLVEYGNRYDEYVDTYDYYLVNLKDKAAQPVNVEMKKKAIRRAFSASQPVVDAYFNQHKNDDINEAFIKGLVEFAQ